jgi:hypothetical protein
MNLLLRCLMLIRFIKSKVNKLITIKEHRKSRFKGVKKTSNFKTRLQMFHLCRKYKNIRN